VPIWNPAILFDCQTTIGRKNPKLPGGIEKAESGSSLSSKHSAKLPLPAAWRQFGKFTLFQSAFG